MRLIHIQRNTGVSDKLNHFKAANFQRQLSKILYWFSLMLFVVFIKISFASNHHAFVHFCISWIHKTRACFPATFPRRAKIFRASTAITTKYMSHFHSSRVNADTPMVSGKRKLKITMLQVLFMLKTYILLLL